MSTSIDLERNYEVPEKGRKNEEKEKRGKKIELEKETKEEDCDEPLPGLSGTRWWVNVQYS